jgi:hypothetical protein
MQTKEQKAATVAELAKARATRSPQQQLAVLDAKLGVGIGAKKERARLNAQITAKEAE